MNEITALKERVNKVHFLCELSEQDQKTIEHLARFWASLKEVEYPADLLNEKWWIALDLINDVTELFEDSTRYTDI